MSQSGKNHKKQQKNQNRESPNQEVLDSIGNANVWTPKKEDAWLKELHKIPAGEIYRRFPPIRKPPNVSKRGKSSGWGG